MATSKVNVAILDDFQDIAPGILSYLGPRIEIQTFPDTIVTNTQENKDALIKRLLPFEVISTMRERTGLPGDIIRNLPNLKLLLTTGMANAAIDLAACTEKNIIVAGARGIGTSGDISLPNALDATFEHCWALILALARNIARDDLAVKTGSWEVSFATGLKSKTLGILGLGKLGLRVAAVGASAFGMNVMAWSSNLTQNSADEKARSVGLSAGKFKVAKSKEELLEQADVLSIHYVLSERSRGMIGAKELTLMKPSALLVNTSRGSLVEEQALLDVLNKGTIAGAALDVYHVEPLPKDSPWRTTPWGKDGRSKVLLSPHMGYVEESVMVRFYEETAANLEQWLDGKDMPARIN